MKKLKKLSQMIKFNLKTLIGFELFYKLGSTIIFIPFFLSLFNLILKLTGFHYLTLENILPFITHPLTITLLIILLLLMTFYALIDISAIIIILDCSYERKHITIKNAFILAVKKSLKVFHKKNILLPFLVLFLIPFLNAGISSSFISTIPIPEFILDFIYKNQTLSILYTLLIIVFSFLLLRWLYAIHYFILENKNFKEACKKSKELSKNNLLKDFATFIILEFSIFLIYLFLVAILIFIIIIFYKLLGHFKALESFSITIIWLLIGYTYILITLLSTPISYAIISYLFYSHKEKKQEKIIHVQIKENELKKAKKKFQIFKYVILAMIIGSCSTLTYLILNKQFFLKVDYDRIIEVTAHRGASLNYPENTMSSFVGAKELGADWIELDVAQTKDNQIIVTHDTNLKRITGVNKKVWETNYDEIKDLDAGSFFSKDYSFERIPLLEDVINYAKNNALKLNIELKPTGYENNFEQNVIDIIVRNDFIDDCYLASQNYNVMENAKKYNNKIKTLYVMSFAYGDILNFVDADSFSIEATSINKKLVNEIHSSGKAIFAWTINTEESIQNMINLNVDNIITDDITLAREVIAREKENTIIHNIVKKINDFLK